MTRATEQPLSSRTTCFFLGIILCLAFALRIAAAQGGLWTDEAWSMVYAQDAGGPLGVVTRINHDNNHHINTIWLQLTGMGAPSPVMRGLSIISGTASIWIAAMIGARRDGWTAVATAGVVVEAGTKPPQAASAENTTTRLRPPFLAR